jgi:hypothetical protein
VAEQGLRVESDARDQLICLVSGAAFCWLRDNLVAAVPVNKVLRLPPQKVIPATTADQ